ncbi:MAG TPA: phosphohistidine phosphatase SixA [Methanomicrobiales archaeon]|nr:phosphohistidine phosphatase SixA [Methanomicrobiales archaeon]
MDVLILRHGKAEKRGFEGKADGDRLLTPKGAKEIRGVAKWMVRAGISPEVIATSPLSRARETAEIVAEGISYGGEVVLWDELGPGPDPGAVAERLAGLPDVSLVLLVGHEPQLSGLAARLAGAGAGARIALGKGGMVKIQGYDPASGISGELAWLLTPDLIRDMT